MFCNKLSKLGILQDYCHHWDYCARNLGKTSKKKQITAEREQNNNVILRIASRCRPVCVSNKTELKVLINKDKQPVCCGITLIVRSVIFTLTKTLFPQDFTKPFVLCLCRCV